MTKQTRSASTSSPSSTRGASAWEYLDGVLDTGGATDIKVMYVNNASTDGSRAVLDEFVARHTRSRSSRCPGGWRPTPGTPGQARRPATTCCSCRTATSRTGTRAALARRLAETGDRPAALRPRAHPLAHHPAGQRRRTAVRSRPRRLQRHGPPEILWNATTTLANRLVQAGFHAAPRAVHRRRLRRGAALGRRAAGRRPDRGPRRRPAAPHRAGRHAARGRVVRALQPVRRYAGAARTGARRTPSSGSSSSPPWSAAT